MKKILVFLLDLLLIISIATLCLCINVRSLSVSFIEEGVIKDMILEEVGKSIASTFPGLPESVIHQFQKNIQENEDIIRIINKYLSSIKLGSDGQVELDTPNIDEELLGIASDGITMAEEFIGISLPQEQRTLLEQQLLEGNRQISEEIEETIGQEAAKNSDLMNILRIYALVTSTTIHLLLGAFSGILCLFIILLSYRKSKWMKNIGFVGILTAVLVGFLFPNLLLILGQEILPSIGGTQAFQMERFYTQGMIFGGIGLLFLVIYSLKKLVRKW